MWYNIYRTKEKPTGKARKRENKMAKAVATCKCATCGKEFEIIKRNMRNSTAARDFEEWASENCDECSECYKARIEAEKAERFNEIDAEVNFPTLTAVSDKQMAFANKRRIEYVVEHTETIKAMSKFLKTLDSRKEELERMCAEHGTTFEAEYKRTIDLYKKEYTILTETSAGKILDVLFA